MRIMIVEDDPVTRAILIQVIRRVFPKSVTAEFEDADSALDYWEQKGADMVLVDYGLNGVKTGVVILEAVRKSARWIPCILITGRADRESVLLAKQFKVDDYVVKPINPKDLIARMTNFIGPVKHSEADAEALPESLEKYLEQELRADRLTIPVSASLLASVCRSPGSDTVVDPQLFAEFATEPAFATRVLGMANTAPYHRGTAVVDTLQKALETLGLDPAINIVKELSLYPGSQITDPELKAVEDKYLQDCAALVPILDELHKHADFDRNACRTSALLHRNGELVLLSLMQRWLDAGKSLDSSKTPRLFAQFTEEANDHINSRWGVPMVIRQRANAVNSLPQGIVKPETLAMYLACLARRGDSSREVTRPLAQLGLQLPQWQQILQATTAHQLVSTAPPPQPTASGEASAPESESVPNSSAV